MVIKKIITGTAAIPLSIIAVLLIIYFFFLPPVLKYIIEDQGEKHLGRKVEVGYTSFNIFRGSFNMHNFKVYEADNQRLFLSFRRFYINFNVPDLFRKVYHIESVGLDEPVIHISQVDSTFNFTDILDRFSSDTTTQAENETLDDTTGSSEPLKYIVENFSLTSGTVSYANPDFKLKDTLKDLNLSVPVVSYENAMTELAFSFNLASGGNFRGKSTWNGENQTIILIDTIENFNLSNYKHYLDPYLKAGSLQGYLHTHNLLIANTSTYDLSLAGDLSLTDFALTDSAGVMVSGFRKFSASFDTISFSEDILSFDTISLVEPVINFVVTPEGDNFSALMPASSSEDTISADPLAETDYSGENPVEMMVAYVQESMQTYLFKNYRINQIQLINGKVVYDDRSLDEPFLATIDSLHLTLGNLTTEVDRSYGSLDARMNEEGQFHAQISVNPRDLLNMDLKYEISSLMVPDFNPFAVYYIAYPFPRGAINYHGSLVIADHKLNSENKILIEKIYLGEKVDNTTAVGLPIKLAIAILRDRQGDIRLNIPVEGDLNDPKFKIGRLILDILKNLVIKAATAPYDLLASAFGGNEEDYKDLRYEYLQENPGEKQQNQLARIASILTEKPELTVSFSQVVDRGKEKAEIVMLETMIGLSLVKKYYPLAEIEKAEQIQQSLMTGRNLALDLYLKDMLVIPAERFTVTTASDPALINPEYPYFTIKFDVKE